jgi:hypothetical protein
LLRHAGEAARSAQHAAGNLKNHHVGILGAVLIRVNVRIFYRAIAQSALQRCARTAHDFYESRER